VSPSPVKVAAQRMGIPVSHDLHDALHVGADLGVVVAYGRIIPVDVLAHLPMINVHFSLLPRWRGAAPVERALLAGDTMTGACIMRVEEGLDTGVVYDQVSQVVREDHTLSTLRNDLVTAALPLLVRAVTQGVGVGAPQQGEPVLAAKIDVKELRIDFARSARDVVALTRLETAWFMHADQRIRVVSARLVDDTTTVAPGSIIRIDQNGVHVQCLDGVVCLREVQPAGKRAMAAAAWANGARLGASLA
jgi:methionyl-tRNA formyltransferase